MKPASAVPRSILTTFSLALVLMLMGCSTWSEDPRGTTASGDSVSADTEKRHTNPEKESRDRSSLPKDRGVGPVSNPGSRPSTYFSKLSPKPYPGPAKTTIEGLEGYKTKCEYVMVPSKRHPRNVCAVSLPLDYEADPSRRYPLVIAFGGAGECARPPRRGALAWIDYYRTDEAVVALEDSTLEAGDFRGLAVPKEIKDFNRRLKKRPYSGIILACPASPLIMGSTGPEFPDYEEYIMMDLIPALKKRYRILEDGLGVDGVSMGGARSMYYGFKYPEVFKSIGSVQAAVGPFMDLYSDLIRRNRDLLRQRSIQMVTSNRDVMARSVKKLYKLLKANDIPCEFRMLTGPHDYIFNQGPGALALLVFHDHALNPVPQGPVK